METKNTRLRYVSAKDPNFIVKWVNNLSYKIEIKEGPTFVKGRFYLWYVLPDEPVKDPGIIILD